MSEKNASQLTQEELGQVRKAMEEFGDKLLTPLVKPEMEKVPAEVEKRPRKRRKTLVVVLAAAFVAAVLFWIWSERYWLWPNPMSQRKNTVSMTSTCMYLIGEDGNLYFYNPFNHESRSLAQWDDVVSIDANWSCVIGLQRNGTVKYLGDVAEECLQWKGLKAVTISGGQVVGLRKNGTVVATESYEDEVCDWRNIVGITAGNGFVAGLRRDGTVVMTQIQKEWLVEELQKTEQWEEIIAISAYDDHIVGLKKDGTVVAAGLNIYGECDVQDWKNVVSINAGQDVTVGVCADGSVLVAGEQIFYDGTNEALTDEIRRLTAGKRVVSAYGTSVDIYILCDDGVLYCIERDRSVSIDILCLTTILEDVKLP